MGTSQSSAKPAVFVETYGCQMNVLDSELVEGALESAGYPIAPCAEQAGVVLINTCSVRELAEHKAWSALGRLAMRKREEQPELVIGVFGCMAEREFARIVRRVPEVSLVCAPSRLGELPALVAGALAGRPVAVAIAGHAQRKASELVEPVLLDGQRTISTPYGAAQAFVRVTNGCNKLCSFCVVPFTRGPEAHRSPAEIVAEVRRLVDGGVQEVTLLGQTVNHYLYRDGGRSTTFADLLAMVHEAIPGLPRLRFVTSYPRDFDDATLDVMAGAPRICRYLHLPAQSGSNRMLQLMNRGYTVEEYRGLLERARARMPDVTFAGDLIAGFPTESEEDHQASLELLRRARYKTCFVFKYSPRPGTVAARRFTDDVDEETKRRRNHELLELQASLSLQHNQSRADALLEVLVEGQSKLRARQEEEPREETLSVAEPGGTRLIARTRGDEIVAFDGPAELIGRIVTVRAVGATSLTILAQACQ